MPACPACAADDSRPSHLGRGEFEDLQYQYLGCARCGTLFCLPMPSPSLLDRMYAPAYLAEHYGRELDGESQSRELAAEIDEVIEGLARRKPGARTLDVGCGAGRFLSAARRAGLDAEGHERHPDSAALTASRLGAKVHSGPLGALAAAGHRYDVVHLADVLEHCPDPLDLIEQALPLVSPGGRVVLRGPLENQPNLFQRAMRWRRGARGLLGRLPPVLMPPYHVLLFTLAGWHALLARAGLRLIDERVYEVHWPAPERFSPSVISLVKEASLRVSCTRLGRRLSLGNRVVTHLERQARPAR
jgi:SAM-dependent methyltransferase